MVFIGDFFQISPVEPKSSNEWSAFKNDYKSIWFFDCEGYKELDPIFIEFSFIHRHKDNELKNKLESIRQNQFDSTVLDYFNKRFGLKVPPSSIVLCSTNKMVDEYNNSYLNKLSRDAYTYIGESKNFKESEMPTDKELVLKERARVMMIHNDSNGRWYNGSFAVITGLMKNKIKIKVIEGENKYSAEYEVGKEVWEKYDYRLGGHQFIMDDSLTNRQVRIRSAQGNQILLDDNEGMIYFINKSGKVWMEMTGANQLVLYADTEITMRTKGDFNVRADRNINLEAGQDVNIKAAGDTTNAGESGTEYAGPGVLGNAPTGVGGNFIVESQNETRFVSSASILGTSAAGDIQFNAAGVFNGTAGTDVNLKAGGGSLFAESSSTTHIKAGSAVNITAGSNINENSGGRIMMNSGGPNASAATDASTVASIATNTFNDEPYSEIEYDAGAEDPLKGKGGVRSGEAKEISTITSNYITLEPWIGHNISDPRDQIEKPPGIGGTAPEDNPPPTAPLTPDTPADVNTPDGFSAGVGFEGSSPSYISTNGAQSNWDVPAQKTIGPEKVTAVISALNKSLPPVRSATLTADKTKIIGSVTRVEKGIGDADLIGIDYAGRKASIQQGQLKEMKSNINRAKMTSADNVEFLGELEDIGITAYTEGSTVVYTDQNGNSIRDVSQGNITDETNYQLVQAEFMAEKEKVGSIINVPVSDNQLSALTSMSMHISFDEMVRSPVVDATNAGAFSQVPAIMMNYQYGMTPSGPVLKQDYRDRRIYEGELFMTPDNIPLPSYGTNSVPWAQQAKDLRRARKMYTSVFGEPISIVDPIVVVDPGPVKPDPRPNPGGPEVIVDDWSDWNV